MAPRRDRPPEDDAAATFQRRKSAAWSCKPGLAVLDKAGGLQLLRVSALPPLEARVCCGCTTRVVADDAVRCKRAAAHAHGEGAGLGISRAVLAGYRLLERGRVTERVAV